MSASDISQLETSLRYLTTVNLGLLILAGIIALAIGVLSVVIAKKSEILIRARDSQLASDLKEKDGQIATAREAAARANEKAEEAKLEQEKLRRENLELEEFVLPRGLSFSMELLEQLKQFAGVPVIIGSAPDFDARRFADRLGELLQMSGWKVTKNDELPWSLFGAAMPDDVAIITRPDDPSESEQAHAERERGLAAAEMVFTVMQFSNVDAIKIKRTDIPGLTRDGICVLVGVKSARQIFSRRAQEELRERLRKTNQQNK